MPMLTTKAIITTIIAVIGFAGTLIGTVIATIGWADTEYMPRTEVVSTLNAHITSDTISLEKLRNENQWRFIELRVHQIDESLARYHDKGVSTLNDAERHRYNTLVTSAEAIETERNELLGITNN